MTLTQRKYRKQLGKVIGEEALPILPHMFRMAELMMLQVHFSPSETFARSRSMPGLCSGVSQVPPPLAPLQHREQLMADLPPERLLVNTRP